VRSNSTDSNSKALRNPLNNVSGSRLDPARWGRVCDSSQRASSVVLKSIPITMIECVRL
jgi:hypothetical protein